MRSDRSQEPLRRPGVPDGFTVVEALFALTLGFFLVGAAWSVVTVQSRTAMEATVTAERLDAARMVRGVLGSELRAGRRGRDWSVFGTDSLRLRAFRGVAIPCGSLPTDEVLVRFRGPRRPEPAKDSVLVLRSDGSWRALDLVGAYGIEESGGAGVPSCPPDPGAGDLERWTLDGAVEGFVVARLFERGSYHLDDEAFRYRSGGGGRQPLIAEVLASGSEWRGGSSEGTLRLRMIFSEDPGSSSAGERASTLWFHYP